MKMKTTGKPEDNNETSHTDRLQSCEMDPHDIGYGDNFPPFLSKVIIIQAQEMWRIS